MTKRFTLYLIKEILPFYFAGLIVLLILLLGVFLLDILAGVLARGASPNLVALFLLYKLPEAANMGIPLALLFASLLGMSRLGQDNEIKAGLLLGLSPQHFAIPLLLLGFLVSGLSFFNNELIIPWSSGRALEVQKDIFLEQPDIFLEEGNFFTDSLGRNIYVERLESGGKAFGITVIKSGGKSGPKEVISAEQGILDEEAGLWRLENVRFTNYRDSRVVFDTLAQTANLPTRGLSAGISKNPELTQVPMCELIYRLEARGSQDGELNGFYAALDRFSNGLNIKMDVFSIKVDTYVFKLRICGEKIGTLLSRLHSNRRQPDIWTALHRKFAEPLAATAFALFALAIGLYSFRTGFGLGFVWVLFLTFIYYATWSVAKLLGAQGTIPAYVAGWAPMALYILAAAVLFTLTALGLSFKDIRWFALFWPRKN